MIQAIRRFRVKGHSMSPSFKEGEKILVNSFRYSLKPGDVIVFTSKEKNYLKRIKKVLGGELYLAEGDNKAHGSSWNVSRRQIKGKFLMKY